MRLKQSEKNLLAVCCHTFYEPKEQQGNGIATFLLYNENLPVHPKM